MSPNEAFSQAFSLLRSIYLYCYTYLRRGIWYELLYQISRDSALCLRYIPGTYLLSMEGFECCGMYISYTRYINIHVHK